MNNKVLNNRAWLLVLPMLVLVAFSAIIPLMTVVNYSVQDVLGPNARFFTGTEWFHSILNDSALRDAFVRQILFSLTILAIQVPLGIGMEQLPGGLHGRRASLAQPQGESGEQQGRGAPAARSARVGRRGRSHHGRREPVRSDAT